MKTLTPRVERLQTRFRIRTVCIVADRGMISAETRKGVEKRGWRYILWVRMRSSKEAQAVVAQTGRYAEVCPRSEDREDPSPLKVKEVWMEGERRHVVCVNEDQATKDRYDREAVVAALREALRQGDKSLVGNRRYRKYLRSRSLQFEVDEEKVRTKARYDGTCFAAKPREPPGRSFRPAGWRCRPRYEPVQGARWAPMGVSPGAFRDRNSREMRHFG